MGSRSPDRERIPWAQREGSGGEAALGPSPAVPRGVGAVAALWQGCKRSHTWALWCPRQTRSGAGAHRARRHRPGTACGSTATESGLKQAQTLRRGAQAGWREMRELLRLAVARTRQRPFSGGLARRCLKFPASMLGRQLWFSFSGLGPLLTQPQKRHVVPRPANIPAHPAPPPPSRAGDTRAARAPAALLPEQEGTKDDQTSSRPRARCLHWSFASHPLPVLYHTSFSTLFPFFLHFNILPSCFVASGFHSLSFLLS